MTNHVVLLLLFSLLLVVVLFFSSFNMIIRVVHYNNIIPWLNNNLPIVGVYNATQSREDANP